MNQPLSMPCSPNSCRSGGYEGDRSGELGQKISAIVRIRYHCEIPCHVDAGYEDGFYIVTVLRITSEGYPGIVMALRVFFKGGFSFNVLPISTVLGD